MPGELIERVGQFEVNDLLFGEQTPIRNRPGSPKGLGTAPPKPSDVPLAHADGSYGGPEYRGTRLLTWELQVIADSGDEAMETALEVCAAFDIAQVDVEMHMWLPGLGRVFSLGRTRGAQLVPMVLADELGHVELLATFDGLDPALYEAES